MLHYYNFGELTFSVNIFCQDPSLADPDKYEKICSGNCQECRFCKAELDAKDFFAIVSLLKEVR